MQVVRMALDEYMDGLRSALDGLSPEERRHQSTHEANHIDFLVWHMARVEDGWVQGFAQGAESVWERDGWQAKMGLSQEQGGGYGYTADQVANLPPFSFDDLMAYYDAVRQATSSYLDSISEEDLDRVPGESWASDHSIGWMFAHVIVEESQHLGQVAYLRGLQRGLDR